MKLAAEQQDESRFADWINLLLDGHCLLNAEPRKIRTNLFPDE